MYSVQHISSWCLKVLPLYLQNANGPSAEAVLYFSDFVILLILPIAIGVLLFISLFFVRTFSWRYFIDLQVLEFTWTFLPSIYLLILGFPSLSLLYILDEVGLPLETAKVQAHQWYWVYEYCDLAFITHQSYITSGKLRLVSTDTRFSTKSQLVLRFLVTAADVLHSWTIPAWGLKADAVPGRINQLSTFLERPGIFYGQCSEICGSNHSFMPIIVEVVP